MIRAHLFSLCFIILRNYFGPELKRKEALLLDYEHEGFEAPQQLHLSRVRTLEFVIRTYSNKLRHLGIWM